MNNYSRLLKDILILVLSVQLVSCGTILYPERKGQKDGRLDIGVVLLDGLGLLVFLIPGVIAFAVDFSNGTIYLPPTKKSSLDAQDLKIVKFDVKNYAPDLLEDIIRRETGRDFYFRDERLKITKLENHSEIPVYLAKLPQGKNLEK